MRSGTVGIIGRPNVGKSTMLNAWLGERLAIVSPHPQTTRHRILGVLTRPDAQVVLLDSPGLSAPRHLLGRAMFRAAQAVFQEADIAVVTIDGSRSLTRDDHDVFEQVKRLRRREASGTTLLAINKVDLVKKPRLLPLIAACDRLGLFAECIPISAKTGEQMDVLLERIIAHLPEGPHWYPPEQRTDQTIQQRIAELIREQALLATKQEVPHAVAVEIEQYEARERLVAIQATILVEREGQKAILIGRGGTMLVRIGRSARQQIEQLLGRKVALGLWVKVAPDWRDNTSFLRRLGYGAER
jgi:GTP-binding protein Era